MLAAALDAFSGLVMALFQMKDGCCCIISDEGWLAKMAGALVLCYCFNPSSFFPPLPPPPPFLLLLKSLYSSTSGLIEEKHSLQTLSHDRHQFARFTQGKHENRNFWQLLKN